VPIRSVFADIDKRKERLENLSVEQLKTELASGDEVLLVDLREIQERVDLGAVPGSKHVPRGMLEFWADPESPYYRDWFTEDRRTIVYCAGGVRSVLAAEALMDMGFRNVAHLEPGFAGWQKAGEPIEDVAATSRWVRREKPGD
jgi:rhodanese-related sulfurtransferase